MRGRRRLEPRFVGGHPVCGAESRGPGDASADLFDGATWFLTPLARRPTPTRYRHVHGFVACARRDAGRGRPRRRTTGSSRSRATCRTRSRTCSSTRRGASRIEGHDPLAARRRLAPRHDPRRRREPAHLGRHLPRERRRAPRGAGRAPAPRRAARARARGGRRRLPRALDRRGGRQPAADARGRLPGRRASCSALRVHVPDRPGVLAGITQALGARADQHRGLRAPALLARARRHADAARHRRGARPQRAAELLEAQGYGVVVAPVLDEGRAGASPSRARRASRATSRSRTARVLLGAVARRGDARRGLRPLRPTPRRRSRPSARSAPRSTSTTSTRSRVHGRGLRGLERRRSRSTAATPARCCACSPGCSPARTGALRARPATSRSRRGRWSGSPSRCARMGARIETTDGHAAADDRGRRRSTAIRYELPVASAQVKSCVLLAGLYAGAGRRPSSSRLPTRDHTERMLRRGRRARPSRPRERRASGRPSACALSTSRSRATSPPAAPFLVAADAAPGLAS